MQFERTQVYKMSAYAGAVATIIGTGALLGVDLPPWPTRASIAALADDVDRRVQNLQRENIQIECQLQTTNRSLIFLLRGYWADQRDLAEKELRRNPDSDSAARQKSNADVQISEADRQLTETPTRCDLRLKKPKTAPTED